MVLYVRNIHLVIVSFITIAVVTQVSSLDLATTTSKKNAYTATITAVAIVVENILSFST